MAHEEFKRFIVVSWEIPDLGDRRKEKGSGCGDLSNPASTMFQRDSHCPTRGAGFHLPNPSLVHRGKLRLWWKALGEWSPAAPPIYWCSLLTSFRRAFILSLESSIRLASMKSLYLSRMQESSSVVRGTPSPLSGAEGPSQERKALLQPRCSRGMSTGTFR